MSLTVSESGGSKFSILEEGSYPATCYMLVDIGLQYNKTFDKSNRKVIIGWEIDGETVEIDGEKRPRVFSNTYTASLSERAILRRDLAAWRGRDFTEEELKAFDLTNIVGAPCLIQIIHQESNGKKYARLASIMKLPKTIPAPVPTMEKVVFDMDTSDLSMVNTFPEWIANAIKSSESYSARLAEDPIGAEFGDDLIDIGGDDLPF